MPAATDPIRFEGLVAASVSSFTMSPDQKIVSALFDDFVAGWPEQGRTRRAQQRSMAIAVAPAARGKSVAIALRGYWQSSCGTAQPSLVLRAGAASLAVPIPDAEGSVDFSAEVPLGSDDAPFPLFLDAAVAEPAEQAFEAMLTIDSIDIALLD